MNANLLQLRQELHQYPELSGKEFETAKRIRDFIQLHNPTKIYENIGGCGLAAIYGFGTDGPIVMIRCELDALPIEEENEFAHKSLRHKISHKCGHDGHMTMVAGLVFWLKESKIQRGKLILFFQPAEETGKGAEACLQDPVFQHLKPDYIFALHNIPDVDSHQILCMESGFSAEVQSFSLTLTGKESHAAEPQHGINPIFAISEFVSRFSELEIEDEDSPQFALLTPVHANIGQKSYGISPGQGEIHYTIRTWDSSTMEKLKTNLESIINNVCSIHKLRFEIHWFEYFPASQSHQECNTIIRQAAAVNGFDIQERHHPFSFGEDFGWYTKQYKAAMFGLGAGHHTAALHNPTYDFPDEIIPTGVQMFASIISQILN